MQNRHLIAALLATAAAGALCTPATGQFDDRWVLKAFDAAQVPPGNPVSPELQTALNAKVNQADRNESAGLPFVGILRSGDVVLDAASKPGIGRNIPDPAFMDYIDELIVHFTPGLTNAEFTAMFDQLNVKLQHRDDAAGFMVIRFNHDPNDPPGITPDFINELSGRPKVEYLEANVIFRGMGGESEPLYPTQWGLSCINAPTAWNAGLTTTTVRVAIVDSGIDDGEDRSPSRHIDLPEPRYHHDAFGASPAGADLNGHGTFLAGVIGAIGDNGKGMCGVCWSVPILNLRGLDAAAIGQCGDLATAIRLAVDEGAKVINASWGGVTPCLAVEEAIAYAGRNNALLVAAAGNDGIDVDDADAPHRVYPACYTNPNIISVMAVDDLGNSKPHDDAPWPRSNRGATSIDLGAPGTLILGTKPRNQYVGGTGTSAAAGFVSGALALIWSQSPNAPPTTVKQTLLANVRKEPRLAGTCTSEGILDLSAFPVAAGGTGVVVVEGVLRLSGTGRLGVRRLEVGDVTYVLRVSDTVRSDRWLLRYNGQPVRVTGTIEAASPGTRPNPVINVTAIDPP